MTVTNRFWVFMALALLVSFAFGRWSVPTKLKETKTETQQTTKTDENKTDKVVKDDTDKRHEVVTTVTEKKDGTKTTTTKVIDDTIHKHDTEKVSDNTKTDSTTKSITETKEVTKESTHLTVSALAGVNLSDGSRDYGLHAQRNLIGPITLGVFGLKSGVVGLSLGLQF